MIKFSAKRRQIITSYVGISLFFAIVSGCGPQIVTIVEIVNTVENVKTLLQIAQQLSNNTVYSLNVSYKELAGFLHDNNFSTDIVQKMEQRHTYLSQNTTQLRSQLDETNSKANELFSLLETRANQNSISELKNKMNADISDKKKIFWEKMKIAKEVVSKVEESVKKYDDILGYVQVGTGLDQIDQYINDVDTVIVQAEALDSEIQNALSESRTIVASFDK